MAVSCPEQERLRQLSSQLGVSKQVVFLGARKRQEVLETVAAANAFVLSSRYETFGVVIVEALALGKPVVATRCGGPESIISNEDGILVDVDDIDALADAMLDVYTNYSNYHPEGIRQRCLERFGEEAVTTQLKMVYDGVLLAQKSMCVNS
ncbi:MAG: glycosyltransferase [Moraxellaceae bacterium]|nr:glycosyltransferase [Moraxellaceae bacterium]